MPIISAKTFATERALRVGDPVVIDPETLMVTRANHRGAMGVVLSRNGSTARVILGETSLDDLDDQTAALSYALVSLPEEPKEDEIFEWGMKEYNVEDEL